ncbi:MAG: hydroxymethylbilane synthase [Lentisphaeria bacterium]|nr:hydroxymethylbilane synthase [Lentisphaeria bacterium]
MATETIRVGTRASLLARTQTEGVLEALRRHHPRITFETVLLRTAGDAQTQHASARFAAAGFFTREIEEALLDGAIDLAVHSLKDLPAADTEGLTVAAVPAREDPSDALVGCGLARLRREPGSLRLGTSSLRRRAQLLRAFPGCRVVNLRGNIDTRLERTRDGAVDAAVLATAGLLRLGRGDAIRYRFDPELMLPAPGQGALALQTRADDHRVGEYLRTVHCEAGHRCVLAERAFLHALGAGCRLPVAALAETACNGLRLRGRVLSLDGVRCIEGTRSGGAEGAVQLGLDLASELLDRGAAALVAETRRQLDEGVEP